MHRAALAALLIICLLGLVVVGGCLFGTKGGDSGAKAGAGGKAGAPPATASGPGPGSTAAPKAGGLIGGGAPPGPGAAGLQAAAPKAGTAGPSPAAGIGTPPSAEAPKSATDSAAAVKQAKAAKAAGHYDQALGLLAGAQGPDADWLKAWMLAEQGQKEQATAAFNAFVGAAKASDPRVAQAKAALKRLGAGAASSSKPAAGMVPPLGGKAGGPGPRPPAGPK
jgi:hypothetical protein